MGGGALTLLLLCAHVSINQQYGIVMLKSMWPALLFQEYSTIHVPFQLTVVHLVAHNMDLQTTLAQQRVQWHSTGVTNIWFQREG